MDSPDGASDITSNDDAIACRPAQSKHAKHDEYNVILYTAVKSRTTQCQPTVNRAVKEVLNT